MKKNRMESGLLPWVIFIVVVLAYASYPEVKAIKTTEPETLYQSLAEGFLSGQLNLSIVPNQDLLQLANPYDPLQNHLYRVHDVSLYQGKYYLYFSPLPVLLVYLPVTWLTGIFPPDGLVALLFLSLAFASNLTLFRQIITRYFPNTSEVEFTLFAFALAFANGAPFLFSTPRVYEIAIATAFCFASFALFFLYRALTRESKLSDVGLFSLCLSLAVAARPHFALGCVILFPALFFYMRTQDAEKKWRARGLALLLPAMAVAACLLAYNWFRFGSVFDTGHYWQLSCTNIQKLYLELHDWTKIPRNLWFSFYYYFLQPFTFHFKRPFFGLVLHNCYYFIDKDYFLEAVAGVLTTMPFILILGTLPQLLPFYIKKEPEKKPLLVFVSFALIIPLTNALFLLTLPFALQRYEVDFAPYLVLLALITFFLVKVRWGGARWFKGFNKAFCLLLFLDSLLGLCLGYAYWVFF
ncbi:MAG: hypothetical protein WC785_05070 [Tatlockia sp.]|jgi:hypothetical protein